jgi:hypothetical protein
MTQVGCNQLTNMKFANVKIFRGFAGFENRAKDNDFSYLEYFEEKERNQGSGRQMPSMSFSTAKNHKTYTEDIEEDLEEGYYTYTIDDEKFDYQHQKQVNDKLNLYNSNNEI